MTFADITTLIKDQTNETIFTEIHTEVIQPFVVVSTENLLKICELLHSHPELYFDRLACLTALDNGPKDGTIEVIYHLDSITKGRQFIVKVLVARQNADNLPKVPSVTGIWQTANWHEREAYDLVGVYFDGHPDLRRILMPADWQGHPLRKDYEQQTDYHGVKVAY